MLRTSSGYPNNVTNISHVGTTHASRMQLPQHLPWGRNERKEGASQLRGAGHPNVKPENKIIPLVLNEFTVEHLI